MIEARQVDCVACEALSKLPYNRLPVPRPVTDAMQEKQRLSTAHFIVVDPSIRPRYVMFRPRRCTGH